MAKYRSIQTSFWSDSKVIDDFTPEDRYFYLYLLTNEKSNQIGCYEISTKQICRDTGYNEETIKNLLKRFEEIHEVINYDYKTKEIFIINWKKYNWLDSINTKKCVSKEFNLIKSMKLKQIIIPFIAPYIPHISKEKEKEKEKEKKEEGKEEKNSPFKPPTNPTTIFDFCLTIFENRNESDLKKSCKKFYNWYEEKKWANVNDWKERLKMWINDDIEKGKIKEKEEEYVDEAGFTHKNGRRIL